MSRTDKTNPLWVRIRQNSDWVVERHDHRNNICDLNSLDEFLKISYYWMDRRRCTYWIYKSINRSIHYSGSKWFKSYRDECNGKERNNLRMSMRDYEKTNRNDIEDCDFQSYQHMHSATWEVKR